MSKYGEPWFKGYVAHQDLVFNSSRRLLATVNEKHDSREVAERIVACVNACAGMEDPEKEIADLLAQNTSLFRLLADIRAAAGDPSGRLMQDELVEHIRSMRRDADAYSIESVRLKGDML